MKAIMCLSKEISPSNETWLPPELGNILTTSRHSNSQHGITGFLSYKKGHYLQVIEGRDDAVNQLYANICRDTRHKSVVIICDVAIRQRYFTGWDLKLIPFCEKDNEFVSFMDDNVSGKDRLSVANQRLFANFYNLQFSQYNRLAMLRHDELCFHLTKWPNFIEIEPTKNLVSLCGLLSNDVWLSSQDILSELDDREPVVLHQALDTLNKMGVLEHRKLVATNSTLHQQQIRKPQGKSNFYARMRHFLSRKNA